MTDRQLRVFLFGPLQIIDTDGHDLTPSRQKANALIALLATSERRQRSRSWLCSKLWSDRSPEQAYGSLRQSLTDLRKAIGPDWSRFLKIDAFSVALDPESVLIEAVEPGDDEFLEGIDVQDPEFEEWLTLERSRWEDLRDSARVRQTLGHGRASQEIATHAPTAAIWQPSIDVAAPVAADELTLAFANLATTLFVSSAHDVQQVDLIDLRHDVPQATPPPRRSPLVFRCTAEQSSGYRLLELSIVDSITRAVKWRTSVEITPEAIQSRACPELLQAVAWSVEAAVGLLRECAELWIADPRSMASSLVFSAIDDLFGITGERLVRAEADLKRALELDPASQTWAWLAYASTFRVGQKFGELVSGGNDAEALARRALDLDPNNPLTLSLCAHVFSFVLNNPDYATDLYTRSLQLNPHRPLTWDLFSVHHLYLGEPEKGLKCALWAKRIGALSRYAFFYDTSACMNASVAGRHREAVEHGMRALNQRPGFSPAIRYTVASLGHLGDASVAAKWVQRLMRSEPDFSPDAFLGSRHLQLSKEQVSTLRSGFERAGVGR